MAARHLLCLLALTFLFPLHAAVAQSTLQDFQQSEYDRVMKVAQSRIDSLGLKVAQKPSSFTHTLLNSPVREAPQSRYFLSTLISHFADHNPAYGALQDYYCGTRTYDAATGGHTGTDWAINPFKWKMMDDQVVSVVAAATGVIVFKEDGHYDRNYNAPDSASNTVILWHPADGSRALYLHLKKFSLTAKNIGDTVSAGEFIGSIGSSGVSTGPHLHFEIRDSTNNPLDPFYGPCNTGIQASWWAQQHPYYDTDILSITAHTQLVDWGNNANDAEITYESDHFSPGDSIKFYVFLRSFYPNDSFQLKIYRPDATVFYSTPKTGTGQFYSSYYLYRSAKISASDIQGAWRAEGTLTSSNPEIGTIIRNRYFCVGQVPLPIASFSTSVSGLTVTCQNTSTHTHTCLWLFGDGSYSKEPNPVYTYQQHGYYNICLIASNGCTTDTLCSGITTGLQEQPDDKEILIFPNPANAAATVRFSTMAHPDAEIRLYNALGQLMAEVPVVRTSPDSCHIDVNTLRPGIYFVVIGSRAGTTTKKLMVAR